MNDNTVDIVIATYGRGDLIDGTIESLRQCAQTDWLLWIVDQSDDEATDWRVREFNVSDLRWRVLNITKVTEGKWAPNPDLSRVEEIGLTDLMPGGGTPASSCVDWIEVYARAVPR